MPQTSRYLSLDVIDELAREIEEAHGREIFAVLSKDEDQPVFTRIAMVARGTTTEVPALMTRSHPGDMTVHNHPSGVLQPSQADMNVATMFGEEGVGSMIVNNDVSECIVVVEPHVEKKPVNVDVEAVIKLFGNDGPLAEKLENYESRPSQVSMARSVAAALNNSEILAVEAGTGTGKSLAYLLPSFLWTKHNKSRVVIATKTIALQEQLVYKDIPLARKALPDAPRASLVKGRNNYICLRKLTDLKTNQLSLFEGEERTVKKEIEDLDGWMEGGGSGDRADLPFVPSREAWEMVRSDSDMCLGSKCPFFQKAPFYESRRKAAQSRVLVVNQALLFSDLALRNASGNYTAAAVIPPYEHVILDEAHSVEDIATDHFGEKVSSFGLRLTLGKLLSSNRGNKGVIHRLFVAAVEQGATELFSALEERYLHQFRELQDAVIHQLYAVSAELHGELNREGRRQVVVWLREQLLESGRMDEAKVQAKALFSLIHELMVVVRQIREKWKQQSDRFLEKTSGMLIEMEARLSRLEGVAGALKTFAVRQHENQVPWLELRKSRSHDEFEYKISPLDVSGVLREALFKPFKSVTLTSATLDMNDDFEFLSSRNGLMDFTDKPWSFQTFKSPFDYSSQARLFLCRMQSGPTNGGFANDIADLVMRSVLSGDRGGTLVLFTSYAMLNQVARMIEGPLARNGVDILVQGRAPRSQLTAQLKRTHGVLLGTDSYWEGVDLPGEALTKVIITKLPFRQMGDPIFEARCTAIDRNGGSSFKSYSLPLALLKFKQGAGRLIRNKNDRGTLIVADNRIRTKAYGRRFLSLVDTYPVWELTSEEVARALHPGEVFM
ncbi:MAG: helicase C-terminal domain-containing protein [Acidobacteriota bacterium]|nr:helicase C-terminal domain-containing protein [Acidobacteriota bacterium]